MAVQPKHSTSAIQTQLYYDELPIGVVLPWHKSLCARTQSAITTGTADADSTDYLVDSGAAFDDDGIVAGDIVYNATDGTYAVVVTVNATYLKLNNDSFDNGNENYEIYKEPTPPDGWMELTDNQITDIASPFYGLTPEDVLGEERFIRYSNMSGEKQAHQFEDHRHQFRFYDSQVMGTGAASAIRLATPTQLNSNNTFSLDAISGNYGTETRPDNISMVPIFKYKSADLAVVNSFQAVDLDITGTGTIEDLVVGNTLNYLGNEMIDSGSNANGAYVKFANGLLICYHRDTSTTSSNTSWTFPYTFNNASTIVLSGNVTFGAGSNVVISFAAPTTSSVTWGAIICTTGSYYAGAASCSLSAIGEWV